MQLDENNKWLKSMWAGWTESCGEGIIYQNEASKFAALTPLLTLEDYRNYSNKRGKDKQKYH